MFSKQEVMKVLPLISLVVQTMIWYGKSFCLDKYRMAAISIKDTPPTKYTNMTFCPLLSRFPSVTLLEMEERVPPLAPVVAEDMKNEVGTGETVRAELPAVLPALPPLLPAPEAGNAIPSIRSSSCRTIVVDEEGEEVEVGAEDCVNSIVGPGSCLKTSGQAAHPGL